MQEHRSDDTGGGEEVEGARQLWAPPTLTRFDASQTAATSYGVGADFGIFQELS